MAISIKIKKYHMIYLSNQENYLYKNNSSSNKQISNIHSL